MMDVVQMWSEDDIKGTILEKNAKLREAFVGLWADAGSAFYIEHLKRLRQHAIQPYFMMAQVHQLEIVERLIRAGLYMGPLNHNLTAIGGAAESANHIVELSEVLRTMSSLSSHRPIRRGAFDPHERFRCSSRKLGGSATISLAMLKGTTRSERDCSIELGE
jgi:hypothetical protein